MCLGLILFTLADSKVSSREGFLNAFPKIRFCFKILPKSSLQMHWISVIRFYELGDMCLLPPLSWQWIYIPTTSIILTMDLYTYYLHYLDNGFIYLLPPLSWQWIYIPTTSIISTMYLYTYYLHYLDDGFVYLLPPLSRQWIYISTTSIILTMTLCTSIILKVALWTANLNLHYCYFYTFFIIYT